MQQDNAPEMRGSNPSDSVESQLQALDIYKCYKHSKYLATKHTSYFWAYEELLAGYRGKPITFVELGICHGGSLFMWREYFGPQARIIGIDINPVGKKWEKEGFEIHIGNSEHPQFWDEFFKSVGEVDVFLDDGGHTNEQQILTAFKAFPHIKDGGMLIVEDVHASYLPEYGNPAKYSFINYAKSLVDAVNSRFPTVHASRNPFNRIVSSISFYESIVCFNVDRKKCYDSAPTSNGGIPSRIEDFRFHPDSTLHSTARSMVMSLSKIPVIKSVVWGMLKAMWYVSSKWRTYKLRKYFS